MKSYPATLISFIGFGLSLCGCSAGAVTTATLPHETAANAVGDPLCTIDMLKKGASPFIVDWDPSKRSDLEVAMKEGVVVASYSCDKGVTLLPDCSVAGDYSYVGVSLKSQKITLTSSDDVGANLSLGAALPGNIKAALERGSALHLGYMLVGKRSSARPFVARQELEGRCDDATHFIRRADIGAFAFKSGAKSDFSSAVSVFAQGVEAASKTEKEISSTDGTPESCNKANPDEPNPPTECRAIIRVTLLPIDDKPLKDVAKVKAEMPDKRTVALEASCPEGNVLSAGKCQRKAASTGAYLCSGKDEGECAIQCKAGDDGSCERYANLLLANGDDRLDEAKPLLDPLTRACKEGSEPVACGVAGWLQADPRVAAPLHIIGCRNGYFHSCQELRDFYVGGHMGMAKDPPRYFALLDESCNAGSAMACALLAHSYLGGEKITPDVAKGKELARRACDAGTFVGCVIVGAVSLSKEQCRQAAKGREMYCDFADGSAPDKGKAYLQRACDLSDEACEPIKNLTAPAR